MRFFTNFSHMKKYPIGIQDFEVLRQDGYIYVDKTAHIYELISTGKYYFLSRPRRFGKSLLLTTLKYLYLGKKELFEGLWIAGRHHWVPHPVIHISFSSIGYKDIGLKAAIEQELKRQGKAYGLDLKQEGVALGFRELIEQLGKSGQKVVVLIDEYDKPLIDYIHDPSQAALHREILKTFYSVLKDADPHLEFLLITGVSKFSKVSLFSDLNNLEDLTLAPAAATLAGYTQAELEHSFEDSLHALARAEGLSLEALLEKVREWYNGYSWHGEQRLYNPFSVLTLLKHRRFGNYWWETGTPTFLIRLLREGFHYQLDELEAGPPMFEAFTLDNLNWLALLFQTGYLTIKGYDAATRLYTLGYPNLEVKDTMQQHLLAAYRGVPATESLPLLVKIKKALEGGNLPGFIGLVDALFASIPHQIFLQKQEAFFHAILHLSFSGVGMMVQSEVSSSRGRVDTVVHTRDRIYVMEFKLDDTADAALAQIREKRYGSRYLHSGKEVIALGVSFSSQTKTVKEWRAIPYADLLVEG